MKKFVSPSDHASSPTDPTVVTTTNAPRAVAGKKIGGGGSKGKVGRLGGEGGAELNVGGAKDDIDLKLRDFLAVRHLIFAIDQFNGKVLWKWSARRSVSHSH